MIMRLARNWQREGNFREFPGTFYWQHLEPSIPFYRQHLEPSISPSGATSARHECCTENCYVLATWTASGAFERDENHQWVPDTPTNELHPQIHLCDTHVRVIRLVPRGVGVKSAAK